MLRLFSHTILTVHVPYALDHSDSELQHPPLFIPHVPTDNDLASSPLHIDSVVYDDAGVSRNIGRPKRQTKDPCYLFEYHCSLLSSHSSIPSPIHTSPYHISYVFPIIVSLLHTICVSLLILKRQSHTILKRPWHLKGL